MNPVERLRGIGARFGLTYQDGSEPAWIGQSEGVPVRIVATPARGGTRLLFELALPASRNALLVIAAQHALSFQGGVHTGDLAFDETTLVQTSDVTWMGCFDAVTRRLASELTALGVFVCGGAVRLASEELAEHHCRDIDLIVGRMVRLTIRLRMEPEQMARELAQIAHQDPDPHVRTMFQQHLQSTAALQDADRLERVRAESELEDGALARLSSQLSDSRSGRLVRLEAAQRLIALFPMKVIARALSLVASDITTAVIEHIVQHMRGPQDEAALKAGDREHAGRILIELASRMPALADDSLEQLLDALALVELQAAYDLAIRSCERKSVAVLERALVVLHRLDRPPAETMRALSPNALGQVQQALPNFIRKHPKYGAGLLIEFFERIEPRYVAPRINYLRVIALTRDTRVAGRIAEHVDSPYEDEQLAVVATLEHIGDLSVIPALKPLTEGLFRGGALKAAAKSAIEAIRAREGARSLPGALSLSEHAGPGALALSDEALRSQSNPKKSRHDEE